MKDLQLSLYTEKNIEEKVTNDKYLVKEFEGDLVSFNEVSYSSNKDLAAIVLSGKSVTVKAIPDNEMEVISYTINGINGNISELLNTDTIVVNETINLYVEFDVIEYSIKITNYLDNVVYSNLDSEFSLYKDNFAIWSQQANGMLQYLIWTALAEKNIITFSTGGRLLKNSMAFVGEQAKESRRQFNADIMFFSASSLSSLNARTRRIA